jgi:hypothetical protein
MMRGIGEKIIKNMTGFVLLGICLVAYYIWMPGGDDTTFHLGRIVYEAEMMEKYGIAKIPYRIFPSILYGYGYAAPLFYCDLFIYPFAGLIYLGVNKLVAYKMMVICIILLAFLNAFTGIYEWKKNSGLAWVGGFLFILHPYFITDIAKRAAIGEAFALAFLPLVLCGFYQILSKRYRKGTIMLALGMSAVICSHVISTFLLLIFMSILCSWKIREILSDRRCIGSIFKAAVICAGLTMWYWLPMLEQFSSTQFLFSAEASYTNRRVSLYDLFVPYRIEEWLKEGAQSNIRYSPGGMIWLVIITVIFGICSSSVRKSRLIRSIVIFEIIIFLLSSEKTICRVTEKVLGMIQFPWRWYILLVPISVIGFIEIIDLMQGNAKRVLQLISVSAALLTAVLEIAEFDFVPFNETRGYLALFETDAFNGEMDLLYIPNVAFSTGAFYQDFFNNDEPVVNDITCDLTYTRADNDFVIQEISTGQTNFSITFPLFMYKGYSAENLLTEEGYEVTESDIGLVQVNIENYNGGDIRVYYKGTLAQKVSLYISQIAVCALLIYLCVNCIFLTFCIGSCKLKVEQIK